VEEERWGGLFPQWRQDDGGSSTTPTFTAGHPRTLWEGHYSHGMSASFGPPGAASSNYDVTADGQRFLMIKDEAPDTAISRQIVVVLNWADEMKRLSKI
jgi:hypothetical protein